MSKQLSWELKESYIMADLLAKPIKYNYHINKNGDAFQIPNKYSAGYKIDFNKDKQVLEILNKLKLKVQLQIKINTYENSEGQLAWDFE